MWLGPIPWRRNGRAGGPCVVMARPCFSADRVLVSSCSNLRSLLACLRVFFVVSDNLFHLKSRQGLTVTKVKARLQLKLTTTSTMLGPLPCLWHMHELSAAVGGSERRGEPLAAPRGSRSKPFPASRLPRVHPRTNACRTAKTSFKPPCLVSTHENLVRPHARRRRPASGTTAPGALG